MKELNKCKAKNKYWRGKSLQGYSKDLELSHN